MKRVHEKKILQEYFNPVIKRIKPFELRKDDDNYAVGDVLILKEWDGSKYTGRCGVFQITYILRNCGFGLADGYAILGIKPLKKGVRIC